MPFSKYPSNATIETVRRERLRDNITIEQIERGKMPGRIRTNERAAPSSPTDVVTGDVEGDVVYDSTYQYLLINVPNTGLRWWRRTYNVAW